MGSPSESPDLAVIILAKNEADNLSALLPALKETLREVSCRSEILVAEGGSTDETAAVAARLGVAMFRQEIPGYGGALREAFRRVRSPYVVTMDADNSHPPTFIHHLWAARGTADLIIASRYVPGGRVEMPFFRWILSRILNRVYATFLDLPYRDLSSGFRLYRRVALEDVGELTSTNFEVLQEISIKMHCHGWRIREVPFHYRPRKEGASKARVIQFGLAHLRSLWRMWNLRNSAFACDYDERAYGSLIPLQRYWHRRRFRIIMDMLDSHASILDIGCGSDRIIQSLPAAVAVDVDLKRLRYLHSSHERLLRAGVTALPFRTGAFRTLLCSEVLEHLPKDPAILNEFRRILADGGSLVLGSPDHGSWIWPVLDRLYRLLLPTRYGGQHLSAYSKAELMDLLKRSGFQVVAERSILKAEIILKAVKPPVTS